MRSSQRQTVGTGRAGHLALTLGWAMATLGAASASAAVVRADLVTQVGDTTMLGAEGLPVANLSYPIVSGLGALGFAGTLDLGGGAIDGFVWFDGEIVWRNSTWGPSLVGALTGGFSDAGGWLMRTAENGLPQVWTHNGLLLSQGGWVPWGKQTLTVLQLAERTMSDAGVAYWRAQLKDAQQKTYWLVLASPTATGGDILFEVGPNTRFAGYPIVGSSGVADFQISGDEASKIYSLTLNVEGANKSAVVVNGTIVALQGGATGGLPGETWSGGHDVAVNSSSAAAFTAQTSAAGTPWVVGYRAASGRSARVALRAGDCVGTEGQESPCVALPPDTEARAVALSAGGELLHLWVESFADGGDEYLFHSCAPVNAGAATLLLARGDAVDLDGDGLEDATVDRVGLAGEPQVAFGDGSLLVGADLDYGTDTVEALLELELPVCPTAE